MLYKNLQLYILPMYIVKINNNNIINIFCIKSKLYKKLIGIKNSTENYFFLSYRHEIYVCKDMYKNKN